MEKTIQIAELLDKTCELYGIAKEEIISGDKSQDILIPRIVFINLAKEYGWTYTEIGRAVNRSVPAIFHSINSRLKDTVLYKRGYNSLKSATIHESGRQYYYLET
jgi:chromosomal replication initiation ATPase DnaA